MRTAKDSRERGFESRDVRRLVRAMSRVADACSYRRMQAVLLVARGWAIDEAAEITGALPRSIYGWVGAYVRTHRPESLAVAPRSGRPRTAQALTVGKIAREARRDPMRLGYNVTGWTVPLLASHLAKKYGIPVSSRTLRRRMHDLGMCWKRPRYVYADKDPHRAQKKGGLSAA